ncbi:MAG TPA: heavy metal-associated domain-containing protein [Bacteroidota bacterium]|nr:heavy metal-associated domain-containing protein [Bacteroidota bacterium]
MNRIIFCAIIGVAALLVGCGEPADLKTDIVKASTMVCGSCAKNVEKAVYAIEGVKSVAVDLNEKNVTVKYLAAQTNLQTIELAIADAGYDANDRKRDPAAYEKLDACCRID